VIDLSAIRDAVKTVLAADATYLGTAPGNITTNEASLRKTEMVQDAANAARYGFAPEELPALVTETRIYWNDDRPQPGDYTMGGQQDVRIPMVCLGIVQALDRDTARANAEVILKNLARVVAKQIKSSQCWAANTVTLPNTLLGDVQTWGDGALGWVGCAELQFDIFTIDAIL